MRCQLLNSLLYLLLTQAAQSNNVRRRHVVMLDQTERCVPDGRNMYRCNYRGSSDTHLTAICPNPYIATDCTCSVAAKSPINGFFTNCNACEIGEYLGDWAVTYDCSNLWAEEEEPEFEMAGFDVSTPAPVPVPAVTLSSMNTRTSPPHYFPTKANEGVVASTQIAPPKENESQTAWGTFWRAVGWP